MQEAIGWVAGETLLMSVLRDIWLINHEFKIKRLTTVSLFIYIYLMT
jgi:hypothetical protein